MLLEYMIVLSIFVLGVGLIGIMVRVEPWILLASTLLFEGGLLISIIGFSMFWKNIEGMTLIYVVLALLIVQTLTTMSILFFEER